MPKTKTKTQPKTETGTVRLHRVFAAPPARVYKAFSQPGALAKWMPPHGFYATVHSMDFRVGGGFKMSFTNLGSGGSHSFGGTYKEIVPEKRLRYSDAFDDPNLPGEMEMTVEFRAVAGGTEVSIVQTGIPAAIPVAMCYLGWQDSLAQLAALVTPDIPDGQ